MPISMNKPFHKQQESDPSEMIFGIFPVLEALRSAADVDKVILQVGLRSPQLQELRELLDELEIPLQMVPREKLDRMTRANHQGVIGFISPVTFQPIEEVLQRVYEQGRDPFLLILDRVTDVRNFGAICRTAECAGIDAVIIPSRGSARVGGDAMKTSAGALMNLPVCRTTNLKDTLEYLANSGIRLVGCTEKTEKSLYNVELQGPLGIIMGSEEDGISPEYLKRCDERVKIPMFGKTGSLNVSVATALVVYEVVRQRILTA
jgi:23S rRNA (guanosine2251-2'-O)-methyltransferase